MKRYCFYDNQSGLISDRKLISSSESVARNSAPTGHEMIEGDFDHLSQMVDVSSVEDPAEENSLPMEIGQPRAPRKTPRVIDYQPPSPGDDYEWVHDDAEGKRVRRWVKKAAVMEREAAEARARANILRLESSQPRAIREAMLGKGTERLQQIEDEIEQHRAVLRGNR